MNKLRSAIKKMGFSYANNGEQGIKKTASHWQQAGQIAFLLLYLLAILFSLGWATSNIRQINPDSRAAIFRLGKLLRIQEAGLLVALPKPFENVVILPSEELTIERRSEMLLRSEQAKNAELYGMLNDALAGSGYLLTGDLGMVQLDVRVFYKVSEPHDFVLQGDRVLAAFDRLVAQSALSVCGERDLDTILVARPEQLSNKNDIVARREQLRSDLQRKINQNLQQLKEQRAGIGLHVVRVDLQSSIPNKAISAFNSVLTASQQAAKSIAAAQNEATQILQDGAANAEHILQVANAQASERIAKARSDTEIIYTFADRNNQNVRSYSLQHLYQEKLARIFSQAKSVDMVNQQDAGHLIIQGAGQ